MKANQPTSAEINKLIRLFNANDYEKTKKLALEMVNKYEKVAFGWKVLGATLQRSGKFKEAIECMSKAIEIDPNDSEAIINLAITLNLNKKYKEAIEKLEELILRDRNTKAFCVLSNLYKKIGDNKKALENIIIANKINPGDISILNDLSILYIEMGELEKAEVILNKIIDQIL